MVLGSDDTAAALLLADRPELQVAVAAVNPVDIISASITGEGAFVLTARSSRIVRAEVFENVRFAPGGPICKLK